MTNKKEKEKCKDIARELGLDQWVVEGIVMSEFSFLRILLNSDERKSVRLPFLGIFMVEPRREAAIDNLRKAARKAREAKNNGKQ